MKRIFILFTVLFAFMLNFTLIFGAEKLNVVFINPGKSSEAYWKMVSDFMQAAANDFDINLEILYAERDHFQQQKIGEEVAKRVKKPDYLVLVNEKLVAPDTIEVAEKAGIKTFLILNDLTDEQKKKYGTPRKIEKNWIGTIIPDNVMAGEKIADEIILAAKAANGSKMEMVGINGVKATPAASERELGLNKSLKKNSDIVLSKVLYGEWDEKNGYDKAKVILNRYPNTSIIWCANDPIALGAIKAIKESGKILGKDIYIGGLNWSSDALKKIKDGEMVTSVGGHFMCGGWAIVLIYDYANGIDFKSEGLELKPEVFGAITATNVDAFTKKYGDQNWGRLDFSKFSKKKSPSITTYDFSIDAVIKNVKLD